MINCCAPYKYLPEDFYMNRYLHYTIRNHFRQTIDDYKHFPYKDITAPAKVFRFREEKMPELFRTINYRYKGDPRTSGFAEFMNLSQTTAFIVIKDDKILFEDYFQGYHRESISRFFSVTKSFTSALIGIAIDTGLIKSVGERIAEYIPELKNKEIGSLTIKNLLRMDSGIEFKEGFFPWNDDIKQYFAVDTRNLVLRRKVTDEIGAFFHYNDYHLSLLAIILERVTNRPVTSFLEEKIWQSIGMEYPAQMTIDSRKNGFEKMESGLCARAIDLAKFGRLYLHDGAWDGRQIVPEKWVRESTSPVDVKDSPEFFGYYRKLPWGMWFKTGNAYYKYLWWGYKIEPAVYDYFAMGILGQILYISPRKNAIAVRLGKNWGISGWWPTVIKELLDKI